MRTLLLILCFWSGNALALFVMPEQVPVDRLVRNAEDYIAKHREEANGYYILARIHYLAFSLKRNHLGAFPTSEGEKPTPAPAGMIEDGEVTGDPLTDAQRFSHAQEALKAFREAIRLDPTTGLYELGLASLLEQLLNWRITGMPENAPAELRAVTPGEIQKAYASAFELAMKKDKYLTAVPISGLESIVSYEAANGLIRQKENAPLSPVDEASAKAAIAKFERLPPDGMITPVVVSFRPVSRLSDLLDPTTVVDFDLRGYGTPEKWPWVKPELGFLVWDPEQGGEIRSAVRLFGSYTFQIFWRDGYHALASLDDNADGQLSGRELTGIGIWFDRDSDGRSCKSEVSPVESLDVVAISTRGDSMDGIHPTDPAGITLRDGRKLRTWDWIVEPVNAGQ